MAARSYLFVPADRPERYAKALAAGAGAVIVDLEDAVAPAAKDAARGALASWLRGAPTSVIVRVNAADTAWFADDLALCGHAAVAGVVLPKAERRSDLAHTSAIAAGKRLYPLIETACGFDAMRTLAGAPGVERLMFGSIDFQVDLGIGGEGDELLWFRSQMVLVSRLAGIRSPVDGVSTAIDDADRLRADAGRARRLGFGAKLCIHPRQVDAVNRAFMPSEAERDWARRVIEAAERAGGAAVAVDGRMVDKPVMLRARAILDEAGDEPASTAT
ncbi:(S)-citramalyl-CoA lyase [Burkholderiales bacterium]|nr:(S)-citramalyl-CoA lyase [Burkholderiales bacterium]